MEKQDQVQMKLQNKQIVLDTIRRLEPISRINLSKATKMSPTTITRIVQELEEENYILETVPLETTVGRRPTLIQIRPNARYTIGIEINSSHTMFCLMNFKDEVVETKNISHIEDQQFDLVISMIIDIIQQFLQRYQIHKNHLIGIGIGIPGKIDYQNGVILHSEQLKWRNIEIKEVLSKYFDTIITIDNDLKMQHLAEFDHLANSYKNGILIGMGTGIGTSIMLNGELYRGAKNGAGEVNHFVVDPNGLLCTCGKKGCLSMYVSKKTLKSFLPMSLLDGQQTLLTILENASLNDNWFLSLCDFIVRNLKIAINNLIQFYEPEYLIISSDFISANSYLKEILLNTILLDNDNVHVSFSNLHDIGVAKGAALNVKRMHQAKSRG